MPNTIPIFIGYDPRQPIAFTTLTQSIIQTCSIPVSITPLVLDTLPCKRQGLTPFTYSRFLVPPLMYYEGWALFLDVDIMVRGDLNDLWRRIDDRYAVMAVNHEGALKFERASVMLFNCRKCTQLTPQYVETANDLHTLGWCKPEEIGALPKEYNHLVGYDLPNSDAKIAHFTQGTPIYPEVSGCEFSDEWTKTAHQAVSTLNWTQLMGTSVHARPVYERLNKPKE